MSEDPRNKTIKRKKMEKVGYKCEELKPGDGVTIVMWSDRLPATIIQRTACYLHMQLDDYAVISGSVADGTAEYSYTPNTNRPIEIAKWNNKHGKFKCGHGWVIPGRHRYWDPSF